MKVRPEWWLSDGSATISDVFEVCGITHRLSIEPHLPNTTILLPDQSLERIRSSPIPPNLPE